MGAGLNVRGGAEVGLNDLGVLDDLTWSPLGYLLPVMEHHDPVRHLQDGADVMLHHDDGDPPAPDPPDEIRGGHRLGRVQSCHELVQEEQLGLGRQAAGQLHPLSIDGGELPGQEVVPALQTDKAEHLSNVAPGGGQSAVPPPTVESADQHIVGHRHVGERADELEGAGDPPPEDLVRRQAGDYLTLEADGPAVGEEGAGDTVEKRSLPGSVGTHHPQDFPAGQGKPHLSKGPEAPEGPGEILDGEEAVEFSDG